MRKIFAFLFVFLSLTGFACERCDFVIRDISRQLDSVKMALLSSGYTLKPEQSLYNQPTYWFLKGQKLAYEQLLAQHFGDLNINTGGYGSP